MTQFDELIDEPGYHSLRAAVEGGTLSAKGAIWAMRMKGYLNDRIETAKPQSLFQSPRRSGPGTFEKVKRYNFGTLSR